ncbi:MAG: hypothetical protein MI723_08400 [Caulobacterales bacterium]|nr:hypothetical protein [Caulobacterales bacterium]
MLLSGSSLTLGGAVAGAALDGPVLQLDFEMGAYRVGAGAPVVSDPGAIMTEGRATTRWALDGTGALFAFPANAPRIVPGRGLVVEEARTELLDHPAAPLNWTPFSGPTVTALPGEGLWSPARVATNGDVFDAIYDPAMLTLAANEVVAVTVIARAGSSGKLRVINKNATDAVENYVVGAFGGLAFSGALTAGAVEGLVETPLAGGLTKLTYLFTVGAGVTNPSTYQFFVSAESMTVGEYVDVYGMNVQRAGRAAAFAAASGPAGADEPALAASAWALAKRDDMTWLVEWEGAGEDSGADRRLFAAHEGSSANRVSPLITAGGDVSVATGEGGAGAVSVAGAGDDGGRHKLAFTYDAGADAVTASLDGAATATDAAAHIPAASALTSFALGVDHAGAEPLNGVIRRILAWPSVRPAAELEALSAIPPPATTVSHWPLLALTSVGGS